MSEHDVGDMNNFCILILYQFSLFYCLKRHGLEIYQTNISKFAVLNFICENVIFLLTFLVRKFRDFYCQ